MARSIEAFVGTTLDNARLGPVHYRVFALIAAGYFFDVADYVILPTPSEQKFREVGGKFGPHNLHENRPGSFQSEDVIIATYHNAGIRVFDIADAYHPTEAAFYVPPAPERLVDFRPGAELVTQSTDVFAAADGTLYVTDTNGGLSILALEG